MNNRPKVAVVVVLVLAAFALKTALGRRSFRYAGTLEATKVDLSSRLASTVAEVKVREGDRVKAGQELATLLCDDLKVASELAESNFKRTQRLFKSGSASEEAMDNARSKKDDLDVRMGWCKVLSPIDGVVLTRIHEPGELVAPGAKLLTVADLRDIWAYVYVPQPEVAKLKTGMTLRGVLPELGGRGFDGTIVHINDEAEFTPKNVQTREERTRLVYGVKLSFKGANEDETLKPGMTIEVPAE